MNSDEATLGGRLPLLDSESLEGDQKSLYELMHSTLVPWATKSGFKAETESGSLIGPFNPYLYTPGITSGLMQLIQADSKHNGLDKRVVEVVLLTVGAVWKAPYELYAHTAVAKKTGLAEAAIQALVDGVSSDQLSSEEQLAHRFALQLVTEYKIDTELYEEAERIFGKVGLVEMVYSVGMYLLTCAMLKTFEIPAPKGN